MFDISWGELLLLGTVGVAITGKRDMPKVCRLVGTQVGRVVGLLQGARLRTDKFTQHNELRSLQNELRSGLRELDQVKMELAVAASSHGIMGRALGPTTSSANNNNSNNNNIYRANKNTAGTFPPSMLSSSAVQQRPNVANTASTTAAARATTNDGGGTGMDAFDFHVVSSSSSSSETTNDAHGGGPQNQQHQQDVDRTAMKIGIAPEIQTERAVMEEEWDKQGIGFKSRAEQGRWNTTSTTAAATTTIGSETSSSSSSSSVPDTTRATGSELLEHLERQVLIFDQYDRVVDQQEQEVQQRIHKQQKHKQDQQARSQKT